MLALKSYNCRFLEYKRPVYVITRYSVNNRTFRSSQFMTTPFYSNIGDVYNVMLTFTCKEHAQIWCDDIFDKMQVKVEPIQYTLDNLSYFTSQINIPLVVLLNSYCNLETQKEEHEIFYTSRALNEENDKYYAQ